MATQLEIYNESLRLIGEHSIASTAADEEPRYVLDDAYARVIVLCLSQGWWRFAFLTTAVTPVGASSVPGYSQAFSKPSNWLRTHSVGVTVGTRFRPIDWCEAGSSVVIKYSSNVAIRYTKQSSTEKDPANWPEVFAKYVAAALALECCERISQSRVAKGDIAKILEERLAVARASESYPPPMLLPEHAIERATRTLLEQGYWRFSVVTGAPSGTTSPATGYSNAYTLPADFLRVYDVTVESSGKLRPIDWRIEGTKLSAKSSAVRLQYVSTSAIDPANWTEGFATALDSALMLMSAEAAGGEPTEKLEAAKSGLDKAIDAALAKDGLPRPRMLPEHAVERSARKLLEDGFWRFSVKTAAPSSTSGPAAGYANAYTLPADHLRTYDVSVLANARLYQVDRQEEGGKLSTQFSSNVKLRYVSSDFLIPSTWPEAFAHTVDVMLSIEALRGADPATDVKAPSAQLAKMLDDELGKERLPRPLLLEPGAVDRVVRAQLESGLWKFGIKTVALTPNVATPSPGYAYAFDKPTNWQRTVRVFRLTGSGLGACEDDIDFRDENSDLHANYSPIHLRYILSSATTPTSWTELFSMAFDSGLRFESAKAEQLREGEVDARYRAWRALLGQAILKDCLNERPKVYKESLFANARRNRGSGSSYRREQGF